MKPVLVNEREIAVNQLVMATHCLHAVLATPEKTQQARQARPEAATESALLGDAAHKLMAGREKEGIVAYLKKEAPELPSEKVEEIVQQAEQIATRFQARRDEGKELKVESRMCWKEMETAWKIFAQPDRVEIFTDEQGEYIQVTDLKLPKRVRRRHIEAARLFGLVLFMMLKAPDVRIRLVVECLQEEKSYSEWLGPMSTVLDQLREVQETLRKIEDAAKSERVVPRTTGEHCFGCKLRDACRQGGKYIAREKAAAAEARAARAA
jgi:hypothetical protein